MKITSPFRSVQRVYFDDLDALNILHNVRYLLFIERARGELFNALGFHWDDGLDANPDKWHVVAEHQIHYRAPFRGEGEVGVELAPRHLGTTSLIIDAKVHSVHGNLVYAEGFTRLVRLDHQTQRPTPWTATFRAAFTPLLPASP